MTQVLYTMSDEVVQSMDKIAKKLLIEPSAFVQMVLSEYLERLEAAKDAEDCQKAVKDFEENGGKTYTLDEVEKNLGLA